MAVLQGIITQNVPAVTSQIIFGNPSTLDSITYSNSGIIFPVASSFTMSQSDYALFNLYNLQFFNSLILNYPGPLSSATNVVLPASKFEIIAVPIGNVIEYIQTTGLTNLNVYNIVYSTATQVATFSARPSQVTITLQEYVNSFPILRQFANQISLG